MRPITPEHEAWRKTRADNYICTEFPNALEVRHTDTFLAGMQAESEVARLLGYIEGLQYASANEQIRANQVLASDIKLRAALNACECVCTYGGKSGRDFFMCVRCKALAEAEEK